MNVGLFSSHIKDNELGTIVSDDVIHVQPRSDHLRAAFWTIYIDRVATRARPVIMLEGEIHIALDDLMVARFAKIVVACAAANRRSGHTHELTFVALERHGWIAPHHAFCKSGGKANQHATRRIHQ